MALVVIEPEGVAVPWHHPLHLDDDLLRSRGDLQSGRCSTGHSTTAQGTAPQASPSPSPPTSTTQPSTGNMHQGVGVTIAYLGTGGQRSVPQAMSSLWDRVSAGTGGMVLPHWGAWGGSPGTLCRWLSLRWPCVVVYAVTRSSEPSGASKHRNVTQPWAGKPPPRCGNAGTGPPATEMHRCQHPQCPVTLGDTHPWYPHLCTSVHPGSAVPMGAQTSTATQRDEVYVCPERSSTPLALC